MFLLRRLCNKWRGQKELNHGLSINIREILKLKQIGSAWLVDPHKTSNVYLGQVHSLPRYLIQFTLLGIQLTHHWSEVDQHCYPLFWWNFFFFQKQNNFGTELLCHRCSRYPENIIKYIKLIMLGVRLLFQRQLLVILFWLFVWWEGEGGRLKDENKNEWILITNDTSMKKRFICICKQS